MKTMNGIAKWIAIAITLLLLIYNTIVSHVVVKNDLKHYAENFDRRITKLEEKVDKLIEYHLLEK